MDPSSRSTGRPGLLVAGSALAVVGGVTCLVKAVGFAASAPGSGPTALWSAVMAALGLAGVAAAAGVWWRPGLAAVAMGAAGTLAILLDLVGLSGPPRMLGGVALLAGGALTAGQGGAALAGPGRPGGGLRGRGRDPGRRRVAAGLGTLNGPVCQQGLTDGCCQPKMTA